MKELVFACGIGAICGARSMLGPVMTLHALTQLKRPGRGTLATTVTSTAARRLVTALAAAEMVADKSSLIPSRTDALPLVGRITSGALSAAACATPGRRLRAAAAGAVGAIAGTYVCYHLRRAVASHTSNVAAGLGEDALAVGAGVMMLRRR